MIIEVTKDFGGRYNGVAYGLEVSAQVYVTEDEAEVLNWAVDGIRMPSSGLNDTMEAYFVEVAIEEWAADEDPSPLEDAYKFKAN
jgi:hypothetical protein